MVCLIWSKGRAPGISSAWPVWVLRMMVPGVPVIPAASPAESWLVIYSAVSSPSRHELSALLLTPRLIAMSVAWSTVMV